MLQPIEELEKWYEQNDPWEYETNEDDRKRKSILMRELPLRKYTRVLDIGCGHGYITRDLPGKEVYGVDISKKSIIQAKNWARKLQLTKVNYIQDDLFNLANIFNDRFDLILITGVLYPQYIGNANNLVYLIIDKLLKRNGALLSVHVDEWYSARFPYLLEKEYYYKYRHYYHRLEIYTK